MYLPVLSEDVMFVRFKVVQMSGNYLYFYTMLKDGSTWYNRFTLSNVSIVTRSLIAKEPNVDGFYFLADGSIDIDDLEVWTIPRTMGE